MALTIHLQITVSAEELELIVNPKIAQSQTTEFLSALILRLSAPLSRLRDHFLRRCTSFRLLDHLENSFELIRGEISPITLWKSLQCDVHDADTLQLHHFVTEI